MVKGIKFDNYRDTGDPVFAARVYNSQYVDELIIIDIDATNENRKTNKIVLQEVTKECFMPLTIGGGINSLEDIRELLLIGADKVVINSASYTKPKLISEASKAYGSQCIIVGIDVKKVNGVYSVFKNSGRTLCDISLEDHLKIMEECGTGEFFINNIDEDGMMKGYDIELIQLIQSKTNIPIIASGGAGNFMHLVEAFKTNISALAMASIFHFGDNNPIRARAHLKNYQIAIKNV